MHATTSCIVLYFYQGIFTSCIIIFLVPTFAVCFFISILFRRLAYTKEQKKIAYYLFRPNEFAETLRQRLAVVIFDDEPILRFLLSDSSLSTAVDDDKLLLLGCPFVI